jgi:hypothetical protein
MNSVARSEATYRQRISTHRRLSKVGEMNRPIEKSVAFIASNAVAFCTPPRGEIDDRPRVFDWLISMGRAVFSPGQPLVASQIVEDLGHGSATLNASWA